MAIFVNICSSLFRLFFTYKITSFTAIVLIINELHITFFYIGYTWLHLFFKAVYPENALFARVSRQVTPFFKNIVKSLGFFFKIY